MNFKGMKDKAEDNAPESIDDQIKGRLIQLGYVCGDSDESTPWYQFWNSGTVEQWRRKARQLKRLSFTALRHAAIRLDCDMMEYDQTFLLAAARLAHDSGD